MLKSKLLSHLFYVFIINSKLLGKMLLFIKMFIVFFSFLLLSFCFCFTLYLIISFMS